MHHLLSLLSLGVALLALFFLIHWRFTRLGSELRLIRTSMNQASWGVRLISLLIHIVSCVPFGVIGSTLGCIWWLDWREDALGLLTVVWLLGVALVLAVRGLARRLPARRTGGRAG